MRVRVQTDEPLPVLKFWFPLENGIDTIGDLKRALCSNVDVLKGIGAAEIVLVLEEYAILDTSKVESVLRDGELILCVMFLFLSKMVC
jgi:hypothetical protein